MSTIEDWTRLCGLLDDDPELAPAVRDAIEHGDDSWDALIDALDDAGALAYLDRGDTGVELVDALAALPRVFRADVELDEVGDVDDLDAAIAKANELLASHLLRLIHIEDPEDEDAHPLVAVLAANVDEIQALIGRLTP
ncbi:DUF6630 family protein [Microbacterium sp.]|uniref:DUF6630 family protein n=1 Tax=Microbacterium sp. TaxID=51671 RepID=UPI002C100DBF|nr:hypothetical protein [Microbacterium sp.]HWK79106.1 hypothetical protein [Microbacterium sp.]